MMRKIIAFLQVSVDGFIEGPNKEVDWMMVDDEEEWRELNEMLNSVDALILGVSRIRTILACPPDQPSRGDN
jgi:RibD C-terminal domain